MLGAMVAASVFAVAWSARDRTKAAPASVPAAITEVPWLSKQAAAQIIDADGTLGPLFSTLTLGGLAPTSDERARIAEFARANNVAIELEVVDDQLVAIRFDVSYGGCCGYEGAEVLALRAHRPTLGGGCVGGPKRWVNSWALTHDDGTFLRARVDINRVSFRWERTLSTDEVLAQAEELLDADTTALARRARERWSAVGRDRFALEVPYSSELYEDELFGRRNYLTITADRGRVAELALDVHAGDERSLRDALTAHWGRPSIRGSTWTWRKADRVIEADVDEGESAKITMRRRAV